MKSICLGHSPKVLLLKVIWVKTLFFVFHEYRQNKNLEMTNELVDMATDVLCFVGLVTKIARQSFVMDKNLKDIINVTKQVALWQQSFV